MAGTKAGGRKAAITNKSRHGEDFYSRIAAVAGKKSTTGGFASKKVGKDGLTGPQRAKKWGAVGGRLAGRPKS